MDKKLFLLCLILGNYAINCGELAELEEGRRNSTHQESNIDLTATPSPLPPAANSEASNSHNSEVLQELSNRITQQNSEIMRNNEIIQQLQRANAATQTPSKSCLKCHWWYIPIAFFIFNLALWSSGVYDSDTRTYGPGSGNANNPTCTSYTECSDTCVCNPLIKFPPGIQCPNNTTENVTLGDLIYLNNGSKHINASLFCLNQTNTNQTRIAAKYLGCQNGCGQNIDHRIINTNQTLTRCCRSGRAQILRASIKKTQQPISRGRSREKHR